MQKVLWQVMAFLALFTLFTSTRHICLYISGGLVWYVPYTNPRPWTKTLQERKALSVSKEPWVPEVQTATERRTFNDLCSAFNEATGRTKYVPTLQVLLNWHIVIATRDCVHFFYVTLFHLVLLGI